MNEPLQPQVATVAAARERLGRDLDQLNVEVRSQVTSSVQKSFWKGGATLSAVAAGVIVRKVLIAAWRRARKADPPTNPAAPGTSWGEALAWTAATGVAVAVARMVAQRGAAGAWVKATGHLPPGLEEVSA